MSCVVWYSHSRLTRTSSCTSSAILQLNLILHFVLRIIALKFRYWSTIKKKVNARKPLCLQMEGHDIEYRPITYYNQTLFCQQIFAAIHSKYSQQSTGHKCYSTCCFFSLSNFFVDWIEFLVSRNVRLCVRSVRYLWYIPIMLAHNNIIKFDISWKKKNQIRERREGG